MQQTFHLIYFGNFTGEESFVFFVFFVPRIKSNHLKIKKKKKNYEGKKKSFFYSKRLSFLIKEKGFLRFFFSQAKSSTKKDDDYYFLTSCVFIGRVVIPSSSVGEAYTQAPAHYLFGDVHVSSSNKKRRRRKKKC